jgi:hypothetical protein
VRHRAAGFNVGNLASHFVEDVALAISRACCGVRLQSYIRPSSAAFSLATGLGEIRKKTPHLSPGLPLQAPARFSRLMSSAV